MRATRLTGYRCPGCEEVQAEPPVEATTYVYGCGDEVREPDFTPTPGTYFACGECGTVHTDKPAATGCCRG